MNYQKKMEKVLLKIKRESLLLILSVLPFGFQKSKNISDSYIKTCEELKGSNGKSKARQSLDDLFLKNLSRIEMFKSTITGNRKLLITAVIVFSLALYNIVTYQIHESQNDGFSSNRNLFLISLIIYFLIITVILYILIYSRSMLVRAKGKNIKLLVNYRVSKIIGNSTISNKGTKTEEKKDPNKTRTGSKALLVDFGTLMFILNSDKIVEIRSNRELAKLGQKYIPFDFSRRKKNNNEDPQRLEKIIGGEETKKEDIIRENLSQYNYGNLIILNNFCPDDYKGSCAVQIKPDIFLTLLSKICHANESGCSKTALPN